MSKIVLFLVLILSFSFAGYRVTQLAGRMTKTWDTKQIICFYDNTVINFIDAKTGKRVYVSIPFTIEEY